MPLSPEEIEGREFGLSRRGYDRDEVDDFLVEVADAVREARTAADTAGAPGTGDTAGAPAHPLRSRLAGGPADTDDFGRLGAEVAAVLRTADEGAARRRAEAEADAERVRADAEIEATRLRDEADGYAHRLRTETEAEAERIRSEAEVEARNARIALEEATEQARVIIQRANEDAASLGREAEELAGERRQELLAEAERQADRAASIERDVHGRLLSVRDDVDQAVTRLDPESTAAAAATAAEQASALHPGDTPEAAPETRLGQGPPTPPVPPPPPPPEGDEAAAVEATDLPYADEAEPLDEPTAGDREDETIPPVPSPPPPPAGYPSGDVGVAAEELPYAAEGDETGDEDVIDLREAPEPTGAEAEEAQAEEAEAEPEDEGEDGDEDGDGDPLAAMVRDAVGKAVQGAMRRRPSNEG